MKKSAKPRTAIGNSLSANQSQIPRRSFLKQTCLAAGGLAAVSNLLADEDESRNISIILEPDDQIASAPPPRWAANELQEALKAHGVVVRRCERLESAPVAEPCIVIAGSTSRLAQQLLKSQNVSLPATAEALALAQNKIGGRNILLACGSDVRGLVYAILELADRARLGDEPIAALQVAKPIVEKPANVIRSVAKSFVSEVEDKPWFNDRAGWKDYLSMLAAERFNRFSLTLGIGYNTPHDIRESYFFFSYPFLLAVPGYDVRAGKLPDAERDANLDMLKFISEETAARGMQFQLGLWAHGYDWPESPNANYPILGLTPETHGPYCRDALAILLKACPAITGLTLRVHGESGVPDGSFNFWGTLFESIKGCGRKIEIDMHAKGVPQETIDLALATGMPVNLSPKYWGEHMGLPYHQAAIRDLEMAKPGEFTEGETGVGTGSRKFMRYGYGDLLTEDRPYGILHRIWPGTRRALLWGDPAQAAGYGRWSSFCGSLGVEFFEPLAFKGRKGSGIAGGRCGYSDKSLNPAQDWQKFRYTYRVWGRLLYNPDTEPEVWRRQLRKELRGPAEPAENALASASRILPLITTAHGVSANNTIFWPEMYTNMPIVDENRKHPYTDTPTPRRFGTVSPFDPQLFSGVDEFADALLNDEPIEKYSPLEVARWLEDLGNDAARNLTLAETKTSRKGDPAHRRMTADVAIQSGTGLFFAWKLRSAVLWRLYERSGDKTALTEALKAYHNARQAWAAMADGAKGIYVANVTYGTGGQLGGHWSNRLPAIDGDIADMEASAKKAKPTVAKRPDDKRVQQAIHEVFAQTQRPTAVCKHVVPDHFKAGEPLEVTLSADASSGQQARLRYRRVNQAERWQSLPMQARENNFHAVIPADYTMGRFPMQYYFELDHGAAGIALYPGLEANLSNLPYFVVRQQRAI